LASQPLVDSTPDINDERPRDAGALLFSYFRAQ
jgi:hypothetical protein